MNNIIKAININKKVEVDKGHELHILEDVTLEIKKGEYVSVMGPSGSGKSTLLYNLSGMDRPSSGSVTFQGNELSSLREADLAKFRLKNMGFIFQDIHLLKNLSVIDNVMFPALVSKGAIKNRVMERAKKLLQMTGIDKLANNQITQASGGQLQRVGICRALMNNPEVLFGDEPTGALDSKSTEEIMSILADINKSGTTIILVTHDVKVAAKTERVFFMMDGKLIAEKKMKKYDPEHDNNKDREESIMKWMVENGF